MSSLTWTCSERLCLLSSLVSNTSPSSFRALAVRHKENVTSSRSKDEGIIAIELVECFMPHFLVPDFQGSLELGSDEGPIEPTQCCRQPIRV